MDTVHGPSGIASGVSVNVVGPPESVAPTVPAKHKSTTPAGFRSTGSPNVMEIAAVEATPVAPSSGTVDRTAGAASPAAHGLSGDALLRGVGSPAEKSAALLSVSVQPFPARSAAVVLESVGAAVPSKKLAVP